MTKTFSGLIDTDQTWEGDISITGSVKIQSGAKLTIKPGTKVTISGGKEIRIWAANGGKIDAVGEENNKIIFSSDTNAKGSWLGLEFANDESSLANNSGYVSGSRLKNFIIKNAAIGISVENQGLTIQNGDFDQLSAGIKLKESKNVFIDGNKFRNGGEGIQTDYEGGGKHSNIFIMNNDFNTGNYGVNIMPNQRDIHNIIVEGNRFIGSGTGVSFGGGGYGSYIGELSIKGNTFGNDSRGISLRAYSWTPRETQVGNPIHINANISGNIFYQSSGVDIGYSDGNGKIQITGNYFKDLVSRNAITGYNYIQASYGDGRGEYRIENNIFENLKSAIDLQVKSSEINHNTFKDITDFAITHLKSSTNVKENNIIEHKGPYIYQTRDKTELDNRIVVGISYYDNSSKTKKLADDGADNFKYRVIRNEGSSLEPFTTTLSPLLPNKGIDNLQVGSSLNENLPPGSLVSSLVAIDQDLNQTHSYNLVNGSGDTDNAAFTTDGNQLKLKASPDYETKSSYNIRLKTTDSGGLSLEKVATLSVNNINEAPIALNLSSSSFNENIAAASAVATLSSTDPDAADTFTYSFASGTGDTNNAAFTIDGTQLKTKGSPDYETKNS